MPLRLTRRTLGAVAPVLLLSCWAAACSSLLRRAGPEALVLAATAAFVAIPALLGQLPFLRRYAVGLPAWLLGFDVWAIAVLVVACSPVVTTLPFYDGRFG